MKGNWDESECQNNKTKGEEETAPEKTETLSFFKELVYEHDHLHSKS